MMRNIEKITLDQYLHTSELKIIQLENKNFSVGIHPFSPDAIKENRNGTITFTGFVYQLFVDFLFPMMNLKIIEVYGNQIEGPGENFGIINMIIEKKLHTSTTAFIMTTPRMKDFDWVSLAMKCDHLGLAVRQSFETSTFMWLTFTKPFTITSWAVVAIFALTFAKTNDIMERRNTLKSTKNIFIFTRLLLFYWLTFAFYSALLYASLTTVVNRNPYNSLQDLLKDMRFKFYAHARFDLPLILKSAKIKEFKDLRQRFLASPKEGNVDNFDEAYSLVLKPT
uniref:Ionotropic glutamate receptor L-glutamate and glycine-binding domain-containing protein n=1 Tax=Strigamia maritima TaxID=126957 RepID=T1J5M3_STRMM